MRLGRNLHKHQIPEWKDHYLLYIQLKHIFKHALEISAERGEVLGFQDFYRTLHNDMANVDIFYLSQRAAIEQQIERLGRRYGKLLESMASWNSDELAPHEVDDILTTAVELRLAIQKLQWFAKVNRDSSISLLDKLQSNKDLGPSSQEGLVKLPKGYSFGNPKDLLRQLELLDACIDSITALDTSRLSTSSLSFQLTFNYLFALNKSPPDRVTSKALYSAVDEDDVGRMSNLVVGQITNDKFSSRAKPKSVHLALLNLSVDLGAKKCIRKLIPKLERLHNPDSGVYETCLHRLILTMGRKRELIGRLNPSLPRFSRDPDESLLQFILDQLSPNQQQDVLSPDETGRTPLHYAAHYGLVDACAVLVERIQNWDLLKRMPALPDLKDSNGHSPLHSSVIQGWALVTSLLLAYPGVWSPSVSGADSSNSDTLGALLTIALHAEHEDVTRVLLKNRDINLNYRGKHGETAIFIAARSGSLPYIKMILESIPGWTANVDLVASGSGWTPLIAACVGDHREAAKVLLEAGADQNIRDSFGWTAKDHVAFRGHWKIAAMLTAPTLSSLSRIPKGVVRKTNALPPLLPDETRMFVNIGTLNSREPRESVDLRPLLSEKSLNPYPDTTFAIRIRATNASGKCDLISLPQINDKTNFPAVFTTRCPDKSNVVFDLYKDATNSQEDGLHIGSAVALLGSLKQGLGPSRGSFIRNYTIPILEKSSLKLIGTLTFDFLVVKPFPDPRTISIKPHEMIWPRSGSTHVIGHRGFGQNNPAFKRLQIGENTINSFLATTDLGVLYVECDVQLTRDHVPVIYHDFLLSESGGDLAPQNISYDQFMNLSEVQNPQLASSRLMAEVAGKCSSRKRSNSVDIAEGCMNEAFMSRLRLTHEFKVKGFKGNIRGNSIHGPFITLDELLRALPENVGVDIELKYPMLWEAEDWKMDIYGVELNLFTDNILRSVYTLGGSRRIIFTSFSSELCILLSHKQSTYPVMFLNESNLFPTGDVRASNLQEAIHFARQWSLTGVVMSSEPFVMSPTLVRYVKDAGLVCASFGAMNDDPENAKIQADAGLDAIIVDHVNLIAKTLRTDRVRPVV